MSLSLKARKRWSLVILLIGLPLYIFVAWGAVGWLTDTYGRPPILLELLIFVVLGVVWILPFRAIFRGIGRGEE